MEDKNDQMLMTMKRELGTGQKLGYIFVGAFGGIAGVLLASLCNINAPYRSDCTKFALIGLAVWAVVQVVDTLLQLPAAVLL